MPATVRWPPPPPGRPEHAWILRTGLRRWLLRRRLRRALPYLPEHPRIVDLGAGTGADVEELCRLRPDLREAPTVLLEAQGGMLRRLPPAVRAGRHTSAILGDVTRGPLRSGSADVVLSIGTLCCVAEEHVPAAVAETTRLLAPGGVLVLGVPRWRGRADEAAFTRAGLRRRAGGRPGHAIFQKPL